MFIIAKMVQYVGKFPKRIHQIWFQGCSSMQVPVYRGNMSNWKLLNPEWDYTCYSDKELSSVCYGYSKAAGKVYDSLESLHEKVDFSRYVILYTFGGSYIDMDCAPLRKLDHSVHIKEFLEKCSSDQDSLLLCKLDFTSIESFLWLGTETMLNNAVIMCTKENKAMKKFIDHIIRNIQNGVKGIQYTTGPRVFNNFFKMYLEDPRTLVLDHSVFEPCNSASECNITKDTVAIHGMELSWMSPFAKKLVTFYVKYRALVLVVLMVTFVKVIISQSEIIRSAKPSTSKLIL
jgi:mannosyltransferase OCH1-like enzyme